MITVPRFLPNIGWRLEEYSDEWNLLATRNPNKKEQTWLDANPVIASNMTAEFQLIMWRYSKYYKIEKGASTRIANI